MKDKYYPDLQISLFPELDILAKKEVRQEALPRTNFDTKLKRLLSLPPNKKNFYLKSEPK